jgi:hypothetical protein
LQERLECIAVKVTGGGGKNSVPVVSPTVEEPTCVIIRSGAKPVTTSHHKSLIQQTYKDGQGGYGR